MTTLNLLYRKNLIVYPRVENDYIADSLLMSYNAHPKLAVINSYMTPLRFPEYSFNEHSLFLHLHNNRILTPANYNSAKTKISKMWDLKNVKKDKKTMESFLSKYNEFVSDFKKNSLDYFIKEEISHYRNEIPTLIKYKNCNLENVNDIFEFCNNRFKESIKATSKRNHFSI